MVKLLFVFLVCYSTFTSGQTLITLVDGNTGFPVSDAFVKIKTDQWSYELSDHAGNFHIPNEFPSIIWISHINYAPIIDTLLSPIKTTYSLTQITKPLEEVVITGQHEPQSAENSVYKVLSISKAEIQSRGATSLDEVLNTKLSLRLQNDPSTGTTSLNMQGISGENIKILIDGVPLAGRVGNQIDLGQVDITQIEKIEIVEGPMAVSYGSNAMGGVINIITKKSIENEWSISLSLNEETVGSSYGTGQGIHNQFLGGGWQINDKWYTQASFSHKYFGGYKDDIEKRSYLWDPKKQLLGSYLLKFNPGKLKAFYKFDILDELIESPGDQTGLFNPIAIDEEYGTSRIIHQIQASYPVSSKSRLNTLFAFTDYARIKSQFITQINTGEQQLSLADGAQDTTSINAVNLRSNYTHLAGSGNWSYEIGYDFNLESGQGGRIQGTEKKVLNDFGVFSTAEIHLSKLTIRPGVRIAYNSKYNAPIVPSLNIKWTPKESIHLRAGYGRGFRAPSLKELYFEFVDSSHRIYGNENLKPEDGSHIDLGVTFSKNSGSFQLDFFFNDLQNQINFGQSPADPTVTSYINIEKFRSLGGNASFSVTGNKVSGEVGFGIIGRSSSVQDTSSEYLFSPEFILNGNFHFTEKFQTGIYFKYTGKTPRYELADINQSPSVINSEAYSWMDLTGSYVFTRSMVLTGGIKNFLNVTDINAGSSSGGHGTGATNSIGYGRSYFLKFDFTINNKNQNSKSKINK